MVAVVIFSVEIDMYSLLVVYSGIYFYTYIFLHLFLSGTCPGGGEGHGVVLPPLSHKVKYNLIVKIRK